MFKQIGVLMVFLLICGSGAALASTQSQTATFTVTISSVFELSIDQGTIDFGRMKPGDTKWNIPASGVTVTSRTNNGKPWYLKVSSSSPFFSGNNFIPNENFTWSGWTDGSGRWYGTGNDAVLSSPKIAYASGNGEENNLPNGTVNHMKFKLAVPGSQAPGFYTTDVTFTMTE